MKAIILAAGKGSRISSVTNDAIPKSMLHLGDSTLIGCSLENLKRQGIEEIIVVTGYMRKTLEEHVRSLWGSHVKFVFNPHYETTNVLYSFWLALQSIEAEDFIFLHADTVFSYDVLKSLCDSNNDNKMVFAVDRHPCQEEEMKVKINKDGKIMLITKQMPSEEADGEFLGIARISKDMINLLKNKSEQIFEDKIFTAFFELAVQRVIDDDNFEVDVCDVTGLSWREVDFPEDYEAALKMFPISAHNNLMS